MISKTDIVLIFIIPAEVTPRTEIGLRTDRECVFSNDIRWIFGVLFNHRLLFGIGARDGLRIPMPVSVTVLPGWIEAKGNFLQVGGRAENFLNDAYDIRVVEIVIKGGPKAICGEQGWMFKKVRDVAILLRVRSTPCLWVMLNPSFHDGFSRGGECMPLLR